MKRFLTACSVSALSPLHNRLRLLAALLATTLAPLPALADLMLYPARITLETNQRVAKLQLVNQGLQPNSYRISVVNRRMTETGQIVAAGTPEPGEQFAQDLIRYSPRQVTLQPGEAQTVRISVRKPAGLAAGEYRSHLQFERLPDAEGRSDLTQATHEESVQTSIKLTALIGASIPVIVRHGDTAATVTLDTLALERAIPVASTAEGAPLLSFHMNRSGNRSVYGNLSASYTPPGGRPLEVGAVNGVAVYVPNALRTAKLPLSLPQGLALRGGVITLRYEQRAEDGGKPMAQATIAVP